MFPAIPRISSGSVAIRGIRQKDARVLERELMENRAWLERWEATLPGTLPSLRFDTKASIRNLNDSFRDGTGGDHVNSDHFTTAMSWMPDVVAAKPQIINVEVPGDGWSEMAEITPR